MARSVSSELSSTSSGLRLAKDLRDLLLTGDPPSERCGCGTSDKLSDEREAIKCRISIGLKILGELHGEHWRLRGPREFDVDLGWP